MTPETIEHRLLNEDAPGRRLDPATALALAVLAAVERLDGIGENLNRIANSLDMIEDRYSPNRGRRDRD